MSMPATTFPKKAYRNPAKDVIAFLDRKHGENWAVWEFRAEGTGYSDLEFKNRVFHAPFPDHHPPPFALVPYVVASMRNHLKGENSTEKVVVIHCKAGKGRSGTMSCAYLIAEEGYSAEEALKRFTLARMRPGFGEGVSIPSQRRWVHYVERWKHDFSKRYIDRRVHIREIHVWGLRNGTQVAVQGYINEGKTINTFHTFNAKEQRKVTENTELGSVDVIFEPVKPIILPTSDINIDFERRSQPKYGLALVTSIAHVWFNAYFEGGQGVDSGVFEVSWEEMDGIKGSFKKGLRALDKLQVVWSVDHTHEKVLDEPKPEEHIPQPKRAETHPIVERHLGVVTTTANTSASSSTHIE
ncbi:protein-tyrosine phosphatase-like protein [Geopyxis carbonaria]|nr:protein-tyrosine phosphatase-like protein [Geopyxis carbonaria]